MELSNPSMSVPIRPMTPPNVVFSASTAHLAQPIPLNSPQGEFQTANILSTPPSTQQYLAGLPNIHFGSTSLGENDEFRYGITEEQLGDILENKMRTLVFDVPEAAIIQLSHENRRALTHLVRAAKILDTVFLKQDHPDNIRARQILETAASKGNSWAEKALTLFNLHNGLEGYNMYAKKTEPLRLFEDKKLQPGKGHYPEDITKEELISYIKAHPEEASALLSNNTIVQRDGDKLVAIPYSVAFRDEMQAAAKELQLAAQKTDHKGLKKYLQWQAQALVNDSDPEMVYNAEVSWIRELEDSPLEFTICRESYDDQLSAAVAADPEVKALLKTNGIVAKAKDSIGVRVGIVNHESDSLFELYRNRLETVRQEMPLREQYSKPMDNKSREDGGKMVLADVDLVAITGAEAALRGGITAASNLPNDDKLSAQTRVGNRVVFHRQVRQQITDPATQQRFLDALIDPEQHRWYDADAMFEFVTGHELGHSLGPRLTQKGDNKITALGDWGDMIEESKADLVSLVMTDSLVKAGSFDEEQANKIYLAWIAKGLPTKQPATEEAHHSRSIMQFNYFKEKGAILLEPGGKLKMVPEKIQKTAQDMLTTIIQMQLDGDPKQAKAFVEKYTDWNETLQYVAAEQMKLEPKLYKQVKQPLMEALLAKKA